MNSHRTGNILLVILVNFRLTSLLGDFRYMDLYKFEFVEPQKLIKHTIFTRKNDVNYA